MSRGSAPHDERFRSRLGWALSLAAVSLLVAGAAAAAAPRFTAQNGTAVEIAVAWERRDMHRAMAEALDRALRRAVTKTVADAVGRTLDDLPLSPEEVRRYVSAYSIDGRTVDEFLLTARFTVWIDTQTLQADLPSLRSRGAADPARR